MYYGERHGHLCITVKVKVTMYYSKGHGHLCIAVKVMVICALQSRLSVYYHTGQGHRCIKIKINVAHGFTVKVKVTCVQPIPVTPAGHSQWICQEEMNSVDMEH